MELRRSLQDRRAGWIESARQTISGNLKIEDRNANATSSTSSQRVIRSVSNATVRTTPSQMARGGLENLENLALNILQPRDYQELREIILNQVIGIVIILNALVLGIELDWAPEGEAPFSERAPWFIIEGIFTLIFVAELVLRMKWERFAWVRSFWNWLDLAIVSVALVEVFVLSFVQETDTNLQMVTLIRIVRLVRLVRVIRLVRMFRALYITVMAFKDAVSSITYIGGLMLCGLYLCALFTTATLGRDPEFQTLRMGDVNGEDKFGTVPGSMYSLFELMTLEGWEDVGRPMVTVEPAMALFLFGFIMVFTFGLLNMIVAMVVEKTLLQARKVEELGDEEAKRKLAQELLWLKTVFEEADEDSSGSISREEFEHAVIENEKVKEGLRGLKIPPRDACTLFTLLDADGDDDISLNEFVEGCAKIRGARTVEWDLVTMQASLVNITRQVQQMQQTLLDLTHNSCSCHGSAGTSSCGSKGFGRAEGCIGASGAEGRGVADGVLPHTCYTSTEGTEAAELGGGSGGPGGGCSPGGGGRSSTRGGCYKCNELARRLEAEARTREAEHQEVLRRLDMESAARVAESKARAAEHEELVRILSSTRR